MKKNFILMLIIAFILSSCTNNDTDKTININTSNGSIVSESQKLNLNNTTVNSNTMTIEEYYPLYEGAEFNPKYIPDYTNYWEKVIVRYENLALLLCTFGCKSSEIGIYQIKESGIYQIYKLTEEINSKRYYEILELIEFNNITALKNLLTQTEELSTDSQIETIIEYPFFVGSKWGDREIVDASLDNNLRNIPDYFKDKINFKDEDLVVIKSNDGYFFFKKSVGKIAYYNPNLEYKD